MGKDNVVGVFLFHCFQYQVPVQTRIVFAVFGHIRQMKCAVATWNIGGIADQCHGNIGPQLAGKGNQFVNIVLKLPFPVFTNEQCFHGYLLSQNRSFVFEYADQSVTKIRHIPFENDATTFFGRWVEAGGNRQRLLGEHICYSYGLYLFLLCLHYVGQGRVTWNIETQLASHQRRHFQADNPLDSPLQLTLRLDCPVGIFETDQGGCAGMTQEFGNGDPHLGGARSCDWKPVKMRSKFLPLA